MWNKIPGLDLDQATEEIFKNNKTKTRKETIRRMLAGTYSIPEPLKGYDPNGSFKHTQVVLGPFAEKVVARALSNKDDIFLQPPDNNNSRDLYKISKGKVQSKGLQVKIGDPNEHIYYSLLKRLNSNNSDGIVLDASLVEKDKLGGKFTDYKRRTLQAEVDRNQAQIIGIPGLVARAKTERNISEGRNVLLHRVWLGLQNAYYGLTS